MSPGNPASAGLRPASQSPARLQSNQTIPSYTRPLPPPAGPPAGGAFGNASMLSASSSNNHSLFSFGRNGESGSPARTGESYDFLPSVSFDDLQSSIESASTEFKLTQFPSPTGGGSILANGEMGNARRDAPGAGSGTAGQPPVANRPGRSGSILRRPSTSTRQPSLSSNVTLNSGFPDAPTAPAAMRNRRQSHYPPVSTTNNFSKPPRKSMGPGVLADSDLRGDGTTQRRRPSLVADRSSGDTTRISIDSSSGTGSSDNTRNFGNTRAIKAKSVQPPPHSAQTSLGAGSTLTPEHHRLSTFAGKSPRAGGSGRGTTPSSSGSRRASMMPGSHQSSHATGLGARTISPTDARRMKRMSTMPHSQSLNQIISVPPPPPMFMDNRAAENRADSKSPSMIPRKASVTPSSNRTTPDHLKRALTSNLAPGSLSSYTNGVASSRNSTILSQPRGLAQSSSASRLPAPKPSASHNSLSADDTEGVPPVPAIPKAYESPKDSPSDTYFMEKKKTGLSGLDSTSVHSSSAGSISMPVLPEPVKVQRKPSARKSSYVPVSNADAEKKASQSRRNLQPLSLPPLNLGPLSIPTAAKVAALQGSSTKVERPLTPPVSRRPPKTPTTPMTASKSSFFSKSRHEDMVDLPTLRSSSSVHHAHHMTPSPPDESSSASSLGLDEANLKSLSPFLSSSAPKNGGLEYDFLKRSRTGDFNSMTTPAFQDRSQQKPAGPRPPNTDKSTSKSPHPGPEPEEPQTPTSKTSLRRKLSLTWKKGSSKTGNATPVDMPDKISAEQQARHDMPPPRIPISANVQSLSTAKQSGSGSQMNKQPPGGYLESRRRKSSAASLSNIVSHDRVRSDGSGAKKEPADVAQMPAPRNTSMVNKLLRPKASSSGIRGTDHWTADLDKDDLVAEEEMRKMGSRRKETEVAAKTLDALRKRATPKERVGAHEAIRIAMLNIYERGEIVDYSDVYFCGTQNAKKVVGDLHSDAPNFGYDDERGDYSIVTGDHLAFRYEIIDILGKGSFGQVVRCIDHKLGVLVAVKIIRNKKRFHQQALVEVNILQKLREWDPKNKHSMVNFTQSFYFRGHLCISTELLDMNLYEFIKAHSFRGFSVRLIRRFTKQILSSLNLLKQHKVIHCDLKPENILLRHPLHSEIKVIDFGSSCFETEKVYTYIQSRFYRSPEVILGMTYGMPIDMWSVGCILAELYTGVPIFPGENEQEQLACIMEVFGPPEKHLIEKSTRKKLFFDSMGKPRLTVSSKGRRRRPSSKTLQQVLKCDDEPFLDFLARCLRWDPDRRMRPEDAIRHEFITGHKMPAPLPRMPARDPSPMKRNNTISVPRPLPDPPSIGGKPGPVARTVASPHKGVSSSIRRASGATAATQASMNKRTSTGMGGISGGIVASGPSSLPRAAGRTASGKQDLAAAGATAAMGRKA